MSAAMDSLAPGFLVASPMLKDPNFDRSVVLICIHNDEGALGLVVNRAAPFTMEEILGQLDLPCSSRCDQTALVGGPVAMESGLLLYRTDPDDEGWPDEIQITPRLRMSPSQELLGAIGRGEGPEDYWMFLGHSGWAPKQLEKEISQGSWLPASLDLDLIFSTPLDDRWDEVLRAEGLHPAQVSFFRPQA